MNGIQQAEEDRAKSFSVSMRPSMKRDIDECVERLSPQFKDFSHFMQVAAIEKMKRDCPEQPEGGIRAEVDDLLSSAEELLDREAAKRRSLESRAKALHELKRKAARTSGNIHRPAKAGQER